MAPDDFTSLDCFINDAVKLGPSKKGKVGPEEVNRGAFIPQVRCYKLSPTMIFLSSWWNDYRKRKGSRPRSGRSGRKPISTCKCRSARRDPRGDGPPRPAESDTAPVNAGCFQSDCGWIRDCSGQFPGSLDYVVHSSSG